MKVRHLLALGAGHSLANFPLQPAFVAERKGLAFVERAGLPCLTAHAALHGLVAGARTGALGVRSGHRVRHTRCARKGGQRYGLYELYNDEGHVPGEFRWYRERGDDVVEFSRDQPPRDENTWRLEVRFKPRQGMALEGNNVDLNAIQRRSVSGLVSPLRP